MIGIPAADASRPTSNPDAKLPSIHIYLEAFFESLEQQLRAGPFRENCVVRGDGRDRRIQLDTTQTGAWGPGSSVASRKNAPLELILAMVVLAVTAVLMVLPNTSM